FFFAYNIFMIKRPEVLNGCTIRTKSAFGTLFIILNEAEPGSPCEIFVNAGKCGSDICAEAETIGRLCTLLLRLPSDVPPIQRLETVIKHLDGIGGAHLAHSVACALSQYLSLHKQQ